LGALVERIARVFERAQEDRPILGRKPRPDYERPILVPRVHKVRVRMHVVRLCRRHTAIRTDCTLELRGRHDSRQLNQLLLRIGFGDAR
jgi:hypothetical protein